MKHNFKYKFLFIFLLCCIFGFGYNVKADTDVPKTDNSVLGYYQNGVYDYTPFNTSSPGYVNLLQYSGTLENNIGNRTRLSFIRRFWGSLNAPVVGGATYRLDFSIGHKSDLLPVAGVQRAKVLNQNCTIDIGGTNITNAYCNYYSNVSSSGENYYDMAQIYFVAPSTSTNATYSYSIGALDSASYLLVNLDSSREWSSFWYNYSALVIVDSNALDQENNKLLSDIRDNTSRGNQNLEDIIDGQDTIGGKIDNFNNSVGGKLDDTNSKLATGNGLISDIKSTIINIGNLLQSMAQTINSGFNTIGGLITQKIGELINGQEVCTNDFIDENDIVTQNSFLNINGNVISFDGWGITDYLDIHDSKSINIVSNYNTSTSTCYCFYDSNKTKLDCFYNYNLDSNITIPNNSYYVRFSILTQTNIPTYNIVNCKNGNQSIFGKIKDFFDSFKDFVVGLFNPSTSESQSHGATEFQEFTLQNRGLRGLLDTCVSFVQSIFSQSCSSLVIPMPFTNEQVTLPCMSSIYNTYFPTFFSIYQLITTGLISYRVLMNTFHKVHQFQDPDYDKVEVLDL